MALRVMSVDAAASSSPDAHKCPSSDPFSPTEEGAEGRGPLPGPRLWASLPSAGTSYWGHEEGGRARPPTLVSHLAPDPTARNRTA